MLGARYQTLQQETYQYTSHTYANTPYDENKVTPLVGVSYQFLPNWSVYANYIEALVQGEQASATDTSLVNAGATLSPYVSKQKEIGIKFEDGKIGLTLDYFNIDRQRGVAKSVGVDQYEFVKDGKNIHQGVELSTYGQLTDSLRLLGGIVWIDAKQKDTDKGLYDNNRVVGVPELQANLGADWKLPVTADISLNTNLIYTGSSYANKANTMKLDDWTRVDLGASYKTDLGQYPTTFNFSVQNVFDKNYWTSVDGGAASTAYEPVNYFV